MLDISSLEKKLETSWLEIQTIGEIRKEDKKAKSLEEWKQPAKSSSTVKAWVKSVNQCIVDVTKLSSTSRRRAGTHTGRAPLLFKTNNVAKENVKARTDLTQATIDNSKNQLEIQLHTLQGTQKNYMQATDRVIEIQQKLVTIRGEIAQFKQEQVELVCLSP